MLGWTHRAARPLRSRLYARTTGRAGFSRGQRLALFWGLGFLAVAGAALGLVQLGRLYLLANAHYRLRLVTIDSGETLHPDLVRSYLKIEEGMPLFGLDIVRRRSDLLQNAPTIREIIITRHLPDRLGVRIVERLPVARFGRTNKVVDNEGCVFIRYAGVQTLPTLTGFEELVIEPGSSIYGMAVAALELLELCRTGRTALPVAEIDISHEDYLLCTMTDQRQVRLAWDEMGSRSEGSRTQLDARVLEVISAMNDERARNSRLFDATVKGRVYAQ